MEGYLIGTYSTGGRTVSVETGNKQNPNKSEIIMELENNIL